MTNNRSMTMGNSDKEIYFIRHGETDWNKKGLLQGSQNDVELNENGEEQSKLTGYYLKDHRLKDVPFDLVLSSPLKRTKKTAEIICDQIKYDHSKIEYMDELKERDQGFIAVGKSNKEMKMDKFYDKYFEALDKFNSIIDPIEQKDQHHKMEKIFNENYEYETDEQMILRLTKVIDFLKTTKHKKILIISHGGAISIINSLILNVTELVKINKYANNCHITYYRYINDKFRLIMPPNTLHFGIYKKKYK